MAVRELRPGLAGGLLFGLAVGMFTLWATRIGTSASATPAATYRSDRRTTLILALIIGLAIGLIVGLTTNPVDGAALGLAATLAAWLSFGQVPLVKMAELILTCSGHGRWHFLLLLEDACDRQVLRQAGTVYQFRHATLQDRLATSPPEPAALGVGHWTEDHTGRAIRNSPATPR